MTDLAWLLVGGAGLFAIADWVAVVSGKKRLEFVCKPATLALLVGTAVALDPRHDAQRWEFVIALVLSLAGDVLLMIDRFLPGLIAFFGAHIAYVVGLRAGQPNFRPMIVSAVVVLVPIFFIGRRILISVREDAPELSSPVSLYIAAISVMVASALASGNALAATGAVLFMASDTLIAWNRFVRPLEWAPITIIVTYHLAQAGLVLSLAL